jgi:hypothetical protein
LADLLEVPNDSIRFVPNESGTTFTPPSSSRRVPKRLNMKSLCKEVKAQRRSITPSVHPVRSTKNRARETKARPVSLRA